jgi:outer membrane receptor protein involved in Fe transport
VRAPNIRELFEAPVMALGGGLDPCALPELTALPVISGACLRNGVPAVNLGVDLFASPVVTSRGDPDLRAETARTLTLGAVARLRTPLDLTLTIDYYRIRIDNAIGTLGGGTGLIILECIARGADPTDPLCQAYRRGPDGAVLSIEAPTANMRSVFARGIDWQLAWRINLGVAAAHRLDLRLAGTRYLASGFQTFEGVPALDCTGHFGGGCGNTIGGTAVPEWKLYNSLAWSHGPATIMLRHRWFSATRDYRELVRAAFALPDIALPEEGRRLESRHYFDLAASFSLNDRFLLTLGVNNLTDRLPAVTGNGVQANTDPSLYDVLGRRFFAALNLRLR